jgi:hypothetical protein
MPMARLMPLAEQNRRIAQGDAAEHRGDIDDVTHVTPAWMRR